MAKVKMVTQKGNRIGRKLNTSIGKIEIDDQGVTEVDEEHVEYMESIGFESVEGFAQRRIDEAKAKAEAEAEASANAGQGAGDEGAGNGGNTGEPDGKAATNQTGDDDEVTVESLIEKGMQALKDIATEMQLPEEEWKGKRSKKEMAEYIISKVNEEE